MQENKDYWYTLSSYCKKNFGHRLYKVPLDAHFTCPNRDGTLGTKGCIFCAGGSGDFALDFTVQTLSQKDIGVYARNGQPGQYIGYFQAYTNTYGPIEKCRKLYTAILGNPQFAGIAIGTRPDCITEEILALLKELQHTYPDKIFWVELGLQTAHEKSAQFIRRGYTNAVFEKAVCALHEIGMEVIVHMILGIPGESCEDMVESIRYLNLYPIQGLKLQVLQYLKGTDLGDMSKTCTAMSFEEYVHTICLCLANLRKDIVIHRLTGDADKALLIDPLWAADKKKVLNAIRKEMAKTDRHQSCLLERKGEKIIWDQ